MTAGFHYRFKHDYAVAVTAGFHFAGNYFFNISRIQLIKVGGGGGGGGGGKLRIIMFKSIVKSSCHCYRHFTTMAALPVPVLDLFKATEDEISAIAWCQNNGLIAKDKMCASCGSPTVS